MPRRSVQENIRLKQERAAAASLGSAQLGGGGPSLPPPPPAAPLKRKRGRPSKADKAAEAAALVAAAVCVKTEPQPAAAPVPNLAPIPHRHSVLAATTSAVGVPLASSLAYAAAYTHTMPPTHASAYPAYSTSAPTIHHYATSLSGHSTYPHDVKPSISSHPPPAAGPSRAIYASALSQPPATVMPQMVVPAMPVYQAPIVPPKAKKPRKTAAEKAAEPVKEFRPAKYVLSALKWLVMLTSRLRAKAPLSTLERRTSHVPADGQSPSTVIEVMADNQFMVDRERYRDGETPAERFAVVTIDFNPSCDCPDCLKGNLPCKHIIFVYMKVLKLPASSTIWYQKGLTNSELKHVFEQAPPSSNDPHIVSAAVRKAYLKATGRGGPEEEEVDEPVPVAEHKHQRDVVGEDCPICYEEMSEADLKSSKLVFDESTGGCGNGLHRECFAMWAATARAKRETVTCVYCRSEWDAGTASGSKGKAPAGPSFSGMGYLNMAEVAGVSRQRDTSSYYHGPIAGMRMADLGKRYQND